MKNGADEKKNQEIEAKFPIADAVSLRSRILAQGADMLLDEIYEFNLLPFPYPCLLLLYDRELP